jgi:hypothetical protein
VDLAHPSDKGSDSSNSLPDAELNPLLNPTLGQHLDRWAEVYFTNPPEKREEAVLELLRELQAGNPAPSASNSPNGTGDPDGYRVVWCPGCRRMNLASQKFCGMCGSPLTQPEVKSEPQPAVSEAQAQSAPDPSEDLRAETDWQWPDRSLALLNDPESAGRGLWRYVALGLALLLGGFAYLEWVSRTPPPVVRTAPAAAAAASQPQPQSVPAPAPTSQPQAETAPTSQSSAPQAQAGASESVKPAVVKPAGAAHENADQPPVETTSSAPATDSTAAAAEGSQEVLVAQHYLEGATGSRNATEAAKWLWKAVGKQNSRALVMLSDLYLRGDGVSKSCDQARLLLMAATKKGAPEAAEKLRRLEFNGCR